MDKFFITTFNKKLYDEYASTFLNTYIESEQKIPLICYVEEDNENLYPSYDNITYVNLKEVMPALVEFKERHKDKIWEGDEDFLQNAVRFSHKVFAQTHASYSKKKFIWLDADNTFIRRIPVKYFDAFLPDKIFTSYYGRSNYTEAGVLGFNCTLKCSETFFKLYIRNYINDRVWDLPNKTDCHVFDDTRNKMKGVEDYKELRKGDGEQGHIIARDREISLYLDHRKGKRKKWRHSPEWEKHLLWEKGNN